MDNEVYAFALKNAIDEIQNICPDIKNSFMFNQDGEIIAQDGNTTEKTIVHVVDAFDGVLEKADAIGGVDCISIEGAKGRIIVSCMNDLYFVTVASKKADMNYVNTVTRVLVPTILKLLEKIHPIPLQNNPPTSHRTWPESETPTIENTEESTEEIAPQPISEEPRESFDNEVTSEPLLPEPPVNQFIVENLGGLLVPSDTVRIDNATLSQWEELYQGKKIVDVDVETFDGKSTRCKVKPIKDSKYEGKGIIQMPEKIQLTLEIKKGELVRVKPAIS